MNIWTSGAESKEAYENWKANWQPPAEPVRAIGNRIVVEFSPFVAKTDLIVPETVSYQAKVIHDPARELPVGCEVMMEALDGMNFMHEGRQLTIVNYSDILGVVRDD